MKEFKPEIKANTPMPGIHASWVVFKCGAIIPEFQMKLPKQWAKSANTYMRKCPTCGARMDHKIIACASCDLIFVRGLSGASCKRCRPCQHMYKSKKKAEKNKNKGTQRSVVPDFERSDCSHYLPECLPKYAFKKRGSARPPCRDCENYDPQEQHAEITSNGGTFTPTNFSCERSRL